MIVSKSRDRGSRRAANQPPPEAASLPGFELREGFGSSARTRTWNSSADELTAERNLLPNPVPTSAALQFPFPLHRLSPASIPLLMHHLPGAGVTLRVQRATILRVIVLLQTPFEILRVTDVNLPLRVEQDVHAVGGW
jgi:hypothetical protein